MILFIFASLFVFIGFLDAVEFIASYTFLGFILGFANSLALIANQTILPKCIVGFGSGMFKTITTLAGAFGVALIGSLVDKNLNQTSFQLTVKKEYIYIFFTVLVVIFMCKSLVDLNRIKSN